MIQQFYKLMVVPEIILVHLDGIMASMIQILSEKADDINSIVEKYSEYKKIQNKVSLYELRQLVTEFCILCSNFAKSRTKKENMDIVDQVVKYVNENYMKPLKIIDIAEIFYVNPAYLGQQFIKKRNNSMNHFINSVRIEKSKELLLHTNLKIYEIAVKVGFEDPNYFSAKFFEYTKKTPSDFRKKSDPEK